MSVQFWLMRKEGSTQSSLEIRRKVETRFYLRLLLGSLELILCTWFLLITWIPLRWKHTGCWAGGRPWRLWCSSLWQRIFSFLKKSPWCWWGLGCQSPLSNRGCGSALQTVHRYCPCMDPKVGKSLGSMLCICSKPSTWEFSYHLVCTNDMKITVIISTMVIAYAAHNCISPTLAIKHRFSHEKLNCTTGSQFLILLM